MKWTFLHPRVTAEHLGFIPSFIDEDDPRPAAAQIDANYQHGGGWRGGDRISKWKLNRDTMTLKYPGDPPLRPLARAKMRNEEIFLYDYSFILILQPDGSFEVSRVD